MIHVHIKSLFVISTIAGKSCGKIIIFFGLWGTQNTHFFEKVTNIILFWKYVSVTQNGHFFTKNVGKMSDKNSENYVLIWENTFCKKWQSGRINFFLGRIFSFYGLRFDPNLNRVAQTHFVLMASHQHKAGLSNVIHNRNKNYNKYI